jgi:hypothetical protein
MALERQAWQRRRAAAHQRWSDGPRLALSLQVQTKHGNAGDLLPMAGASFDEPLTSAPGA